MNGSEQRKRLRNSERTLRTLIDASPESIVLLDTERTVLIANETAARRLGKTVDEMVGQKSHTFVPPEVAAQRVKYFQEVVRTGKPIRFEDQRSEWYFEIAMHPVFDEQGKVAAVAVLSIDRTERKRAEAGTCGRARNAIAHWRNQRPMLSPFMTAMERCSTGTEPGRGILASIQVVSLE